MNAFCHFLVLDQKSCLFSMERRRKKKIEIDRGLENLEWPVKSSYRCKLKATLVKMNYTHYFLYCTQV